MDAETTTPKTETSSMAALTAAIRRASSDKRVDPWFDQSIGTLIFFDACSDVGAIERPPIAVLVCATEKTLSGTAMVLPLLGYFFSMVAVLAAAVGIMIGLSNTSTPRVRHYPVVEHNVTATNTEPHLFMVVPETKNGSPAKYIEANSAALPTEKADAIKSKPHKPALAHQHDNYKRPGYGNALGYAEESRNGPQRLFSSW